MTLPEFERVLEGHPTDISYNEALDLIDQYDLSEYLDHNTLKHIKRLDYCTRLNVAPFAGTYEEQPKDWLQFLQIYDYCVMIVRDYKRTMNGVSR